MRRLPSVMAAVAATFAVSSAQALVVVVDDFNLPTGDTTVYDADGGGAGIGVYSDAIRTIRTQQVTAGGNFGGFNSSVSVGSGPSLIPPGTLTVRNATTVTSNVTLEWALAPYIPLPIGSPVSLYFNVYSSDDVTKTITASASFGAIDTFSVGFLAAPGKQVSFALSDADVALLNAGGTFSLTLSGASGWDISLDEVGFKIPEPSVLGLAGLALMGAGLASRRRRA